MSGHGSVLCYRRIDGAEEGVSDSEPGDVEPSTIVTLHIVKNGNTRDMWEAVMIKEAVIDRTKLLPPTSTEILIVSSNTRT